MNNTIAWAVRNLTTDVPGAASHNMKTLNHLRSGGDIMLALIGAIKMPLAHPSRMITSLIERSSDSQKRRIQGRRGLRCAILMRRG